MPKILRALALATVLTSSAWAQTTVWTGLEGDGLWSSEYNWSGNLPSTSNVTTFNTSGLTTVVDSAFDIKAIALNGGDLALSAGPLGSLKIESYILQASTGVLTFNLGLTGPGTLYLYGGGSVVFNQGGGATTYSGYTNIYGAAGSMSDGAPGAYSPNSVINIDGPGVLNVNFNETIAGLDDYSAGGASVVLATGTTLTISGPNTTQFSGVISGGGGLEKAGSSTLILKGANTYTGSTVIDSGSTIELSGTTASLASQSISGAGSISFNRTNAFTYGGNLSGSLSVAEAGGASGSTVLTGTNTYTGTTTVISGTLQAGSTQAFGNLSTVTVDSGATLSLGGNSNTIGSLKGAGQVSLAGGETLTLGDSQANSLFSGSITGTGSLVSSTYVAQFTGSSTYSGGTTITQGTLLADNASGYATGTGPILVTGGALQIGNPYDTKGYIDPASVVTVMGTGSLSFGRGDSITFANTINGTGGVGQFGIGTVTLTGTNTYSGTTTPFRGILQAGSTSAFGGATGLSAVSFGYGGTLDLNGFDNTVGSISGGANNFITLGTATLTLAGASGSHTFSGIISGPGNLAVTGSGSTTVLDGANTYSGTTTVAAGATLSIGDGMATGAAIATPVTTNGTLKYQPAQNEAYSVSQAISGSGQVIINGATNGITMGSVALSGSNSYWGGTLVQSGELFLGSASAVGTGTLSFEAGTEFAPDTDITLANAVVLDTAGYVDNEDGGPNNLTLTGLVSGTGGIMWCTSGTLTLSGANTFQNGIDMREGTLLLGSNSAAGTGSISLDTGTVLSAAGTFTTRGISNAIMMVGSASQIGDNDNNQITVTGNISSTGTSNTTYAGGSSGSLTLSGDNSGLYGNFTIQSGTVYAAANNALGDPSGTVSMTGGAALNIRNGVTISNPLSFSGAPNVLEGGGTLGSPPVTTNASVVLMPIASPGGGPGTLTFTNSLTLGTGTAIHFELYDAAGSAGTGWSLLSAPGGLSLTAASNTITFNLVSTDTSGNAANAINFDPSQSYSWQFASAGWISGFDPSQFNLVLGGFANDTGGGSFSFSQDPNGLFLNFTPVPEPATWVLIALGGSLVAVVAARMRRPGPAV